MLKRNTKYRVVREHKQAIDDEQEAYKTSLESALLNV